MAIKLDAWILKKLHTVLSIHVLRQIELEVELKISNLAQVMTIGMKIALTTTTEDWTLFSPARYKHPLAFRHQHWRKSIQAGWSSRGPHCISKAAKIWRIEENWNPGFLFNIRVDVGNTLNLVLIVWCGLELSNGSCNNSRELCVHCWKSGKYLHVWTESALDINCTEIMILLELPGENGWEETTNLQTGSLGIKAYHTDYLGKKLPTNW